MYVCVCVCIYIIYYIYTKKKPTSPKLFRSASCCSAQSLVEPRIILYLIEIKFKI